MARVETRRLVVQDASVRNLLQAASALSGDSYEKALGGCIARRAIPILDMIGEETGIPVAQVSVLKTRGPRSTWSWVTTRPTTRRSQKPSSRESTT